MKIAISILTFLIVYSSLFAQTKDEEIINKTFVKFNNGEVKLGTNISEDEVDLFSKDIVLDEDKFKARTVTAYGKGDGIVYTRYQTNNFFPSTKFINGAYFYRITQNVYKNGTNMTEISYKYSKGITKSKQINTKNIYKDFKTDGTAMSLFKPANNLRLTKNGLWIATGVLSLVSIATIADGTGVIISGIAVGTLLTGVIVGAIEKKKFNKGLKQYFAVDPKNDFSFDAPVPVIEKEGSKKGSKAKSTPAKKAPTKKR